VSAAPEAQLEEYERVLNEQEHWTEEHRFWSEERDALGRGLGQLRQLKAAALARKRQALTDPGFSRWKHEELVRDREIVYPDDERDVEAWRRMDVVVVVPDRRGLIPDGPALVALYYQRQVAYYAKCIADYQRRLPRAAGNAWVARVRTGRVIPLVQPRPRVREHSARRQRTRSSSTSSRDGPSIDDDDPEPSDDPVDPEPAA
jgi:hypothetical protein